MRGPRVEPGDRAGSGSWTMASSVIVHLPAPISDRYDRIRSVAVSAVEGTTRLRNRLLPASTDADVPDSQAVADEPDHGPHQAVVADHRGHEHDALTDPVDPGLDGRADFSVRPSGVGEIEDVRKLIPVFRQRLEPVEDQVD